MNGKVHPAKPSPRARKGIRRVSTACELKYPMYLLSVSKLFELYGGDREGSAPVIMESHQRLEEKDMLVKWDDIKSDDTIIFVSHEWVGWSHADPKGIQIATLCTVLDKLKRGVYETRMRPFHEMVMKKKYRTTPDEWKRMLRSAYVWIDWVSMPQPGAEKSRKPPPTDGELELITANSSNAIASIPAYVERADFVLILAPGCTHTDRTIGDTKEYARTCYRTWRKRGWCVLELVASFLSRDKKHPLLLVKSSEAAPVWIPSVEAYSLSLGNSDFTCCQRNHNFSDSRGKRVECDKPRVVAIVQPLLEKKIEHFRLTKQYENARWLKCTTSFIMRALPFKEHIEISSNGDEIDRLKKELFWNGDGGTSEWIDENGHSLLSYAASRGDIACVRAILDRLSHVTKKQRQAVLDHQMPASGIRFLKFGARLTALHLSMALGNASCVEALLNAGADPFLYEKNGIDGLMMCAFMSADVDCIHAWFKHLPNWDVNRKNTVVGGIAVGCTLCNGVNKMGALRTLIEDYNADPYVLTDTGGDLLMTVAKALDADPDQLHYLIRLYDKLSASDSTKLSVKAMLRRQKKDYPRSLKWKAIIRVTRFLNSIGFLRNHFLVGFKNEMFQTPLHAATERGDAEIVKILLEAGADPMRKNLQGRTAIESERQYGPFPSVRAVYEAHSAVKIE